MCEGAPPPPSENPENSESSSDNRRPGVIISQGLETSFRRVWVELFMNGVNSEGYQEAIQQFVGYCVSAWKAGYSLTALKFELSANEIDRKINGVDIRLNEREKEARLVWMTLVYLTLQKYKFESVNKPPPVDIDLKNTSVAGYLSGLRTLVEAVVSGATRGLNLSTFKMEMNFGESATPRSEDEQKQYTATQNLRSQWARIVFATINYLPDSAKA